MSTTLPNWLAELRADPDIGARGIDFLSDREIESGDRSTLWIGKLKIGSGPLMPDNVRKPVYWLDPAKPGEMLVDLSDNDKEAGFLFPIAPTAEALQQFYSTYCAPGLTAESAFPMETKGLAYIKALRESTGPLDPAQYFTGDKHRQARLFLGSVDEEGIVQLENKTVFNPYLNPVAASLATANNGDTSQFWTAFSKSLLTFEFNTKFMGDSGDAMCVLQIDYLAQDNRPPIYDKAANFGKRDFGNLPDDMPLDLLGAVVGGNFRHLLAPDDFMYTIEDMELSKTARMNSLLSLSVLTDDRQFEQIFRPLLDLGDPDYLDFTAIEALDRGNTAIMAACLSTEHIDDLADDVKAELEKATKK